MKGKRDIAQVATISANGDAAIGKLIARGGRQGRAWRGSSTSSRAPALETKLEVAEGAEIERGYASAYFVTDTERLVAQLDDAYILLCPNKISAVQELMPILEKVAKTGRSLLVVAEVHGEALSLLVVNKLQGTMKVCAVMPPYYGESRKTALARSGRADRRSRHRRGARHHARRGDAGGPGARQEGRRRPGEDDHRRRRHQQGGAARRAWTRSRALYADTNSTFKHQQLEERLRRLVGGAALIRVGGTTEAEARERKLRIEDALFATRAAIEEGIVPGGGIALLRAADVLAKPPKDAPRGRARPAWRSSGGPARSRAARSPRTPGGTRRSILATDPAAARARYGYNAARDAFENLIDAGVVDPTMVVRLALQHAASIAGLLLSSEALIVDAPREPVDFAEQRQRRRRAQRSSRSCRAATAARSADGRSDLS